MGIPASIPRHGPFTQKGMTLRDWFAGMALQGIVNKIPYEEVPTDETDHEHTAARGAYGYADAMLAARLTPTAESE